MAIPSSAAFRRLTDLLQIWFAGSDDAVRDHAVPEPGMWPAMVEQAHAHGVLPLLFYTTGQFPQLNTPIEVRGELRHWFAGHARRSLLLAGELVRLTGLLERAGIPVIPVKGPALAVAVYGDAASRSFHDLDLLFRRDDVLAARDVLAANGYHMVSAVHWSEDSAYLRSINSEFSMSNGQVSVDLHWRILPSYFPFDLDATSLWADQTTVTVAGRTVPSLSLEHLLLYLAAHGAKHQWSQLRWLCDFAKCVQSEAMDWERAVALCREAGSLMVLTHALALAEEHLGVAAPPFARDLVDDAARELAAFVWGHVTGGAGDAAPASVAFRFQRRLGQSAVDTMRLWRGVAVDPTEAEWRLVSLPPAAYPLYYPIRLCRLTTKYVAGFFQ